MTNSKQQHLLITRGFVIAGAYNVLGILFFSKLFTNPALSLNDPVTFSWLGQVSIVLWGLAYCSVARSYRNVPWLILTFATEKLIYSFIWIKWILEKGETIPAIAADSFLTASFYSIYGLGDIASCLFFVWVLTRIMKSSVK